MSRLDTPKFFLGLVQIELGRLSLATKPSKNKSAVTKGATKVGLLEEGTSISKNWLTELQHTSPHTYFTNLDRLRLVKFAPL